MQQFSNNAQTTLAAALTDVATELTVDDSTAFATLAAGQWEMCTLVAGDLLEIIKVTARTGDTWTVVRGQEGTDARAWDAGDVVEARLTAGSVAHIYSLAQYPDLAALDHGGDARGANAVNLQPSRTDDGSVASGADSVAIGPDSSAAGNGAIAIGKESTAPGAGSVSVGGVVSADGGIALGVCWTEGENGLTAGTNAYNEAERATCLGPSAYVAVTAPRGISIGHWNACEAPDGITIGYYSYTDAAADGSLAIGAYAKTYDPYTGHLPAIQRHTHFPADFDDPSEPSSRAARTAHMAAPVTTLMTEPLDLSDDTATIDLVIPPNTHFFVDAAGIIVTTASTPSGTPQISLTGVLTAENVTVTAPYARQMWKDLDTDGLSGTLTVSCATALTSGAMAARVYVSGLMVADPPA